MNEQHQKVRSWLENIFGDEPIPAFEINAKTIEILNSLREINERKDCSTRLAIEDLKQKKHEYRSEAKRIEKIISSVGLNLGSLSQSGSASVRTLASTAVLLDLKDTKTSSYYLGLNEHLTELQLSNEKRLKTKHESQKLLRKTKAALVKHDSITKAYESLEEQISILEPIINKRLEQTKFLREKAVEYQKFLDELQNFQKQTNLDSGIYHSELIKQYDELLVLEEELKPLKSKLDTYHSLPPDISLAKVKLEEAKRELIALEEQLTQNIGSMHSM